MEICGVRFAPLNIPFKRRIETFSAFFWISLMPAGWIAGIGLTIYTILFTKYYALGIAYIIWIYADRETPFTGGRKFGPLRRLGLWKHFNDYFPLTLVKTCDLASNENYLFGVYPHGLLSTGAFGHFGTDRNEFATLFPGLTPFFATLDVHFSVPLNREIALSLGFVSASKRSIEYVLNSKSKGNVLVLVVGGAQEAVYVRPGDYRIILKKRKGFIKMAIKTGRPIVPVFSFGENDLYSQAPYPPGSLLYKIQNWFKKNTGIVFCIPVGRGLFQYSFGLVPRRSPVTTVVGKPIKIQQDDNPSQQQIDHYHTVFTEELIKLFETHKCKYLKDPQTKLIIE